MVVRYWKRNSFPLYILACSNLFAPQYQVCFVGLDRCFGHFLYRNLSRLRLLLRQILSDAIWKDYGTFNPKFNMAETMIKAVSFNL